MQARALSFIGKRIHKPKGLMRIFQ